MTGKEQNDRIEHYLLNKMNDNEREAFEAELEANPALRKYTGDKEILIKGIKSGFNREFKAKLNNEDKRRSQLLKTRRIRYISGIAAIIIIGIFSQVFINRMRYDSARIYSEYYYSYPNITIPISRSEENGDNPFYQYEAGNFKEALAGFRIIIYENPGDKAALFYAGIASMELQDFDKAIEYLKRVTLDDENLFSRPAYWYLSLAYINSDNNKMASEYLDKLAEGEDNYATNSKKILKKIN